MGTTKLTRKEILAEDPIQENIIRLIEFLRVNRKRIAIAVAAFVVVGFGIYLGIRYLDAREAEAQSQLARGMEFLRAQISSEEAPEAGAPEAGAEEAEAGPAPEPEPVPEAPAPEKPSRRKKISFV